MKANQQATFDVQGMTCGSCVWHINHALQDVDGVCHVDVSLREGKVRVTHEGAHVEEILKALAEAGYAARNAA